MFLVAIAGISAVHDFYRGYHHAHSLVGGIGFVVFGLVLLAIFWWLYSKGPSSN
jgi:Mn2+/Fe2+ NRAMP family transporter